MIYLAESGPCETVGAAHAFLLTKMLSQEDERTDNALGIFGKGLMYDGMTEKLLPGRRGLMSGLTSDTLCSRSKHCPAPRALFNVQV